ncbi:hyalin domain-containing protein [Zunongwangia atlantica 22II14-10F7]|uniref:Hyalin domain-containing protein n=2 Tax=Zunongwangia TaxID=417127 RepID=A0A1Y1T6M4_9FLAO|nr:hyalin domain-containing protein [Zunongwangia atlantica 22II14-10F7]
MPMKKTTFPGAIVILGLFFIIFLTNQSTSFGLEEDLIITSSQANLTCYNAGNGSINIEVSGGSGNYTYVWSGPNSFTSSNEDISNLESGTYIVSVSDDAGNNGSESITIIQPNELLIESFTSSNVSCFGGNDGIISAETISGGTPPYQYSINGSDFFTNSTFEDLAAGNYTLTVIDQNNCSISSNIEISQPEQLEMTAATSDNVSCFGGNDGIISAGTISGGTAPYQYSINGTDFFANSTFEDLAAGNYTLTVIDQNNCSISTNIEITQPEQLEMTAATSTKVSCFSGNDASISAGTVSGGTAPYQYSINGTDFFTNSTFEDLTAGNYTLTVIDQNNCSISTNIEITQPEQLEMTAATSDNVSCFGGNDASISAGTISGGTAPYQYSINGIDFFTNSTFFEDLTAGNYTLTVRDQNNCSISTNIEITQPEQLEMTAPTSTNVSCFGGNDASISAGTISGGTQPYSYSIDGINYQSDGDFSNLSSGTYTLSIIDANDCVISATIEISEPNAISATSASITNVSCYGTATGEISVGTISGGTAPFEYSIDNINFQTDKTFSNLPAGNYTIFIRDANNCSLQQIANITQPARLNASYNITYVSCFGGNSGIINFTGITGGSGNYQFSIDNGNTWSNSANFNNLSTGNYSLKIRDQNSTSCEQIIAENINLTQPSAPLSVTASTTRTTVFNSRTGSATANVTGGTAGYTYQWRLAGSATVIATTRRASDLAAGNYSLQVTDRNRCSQTINVRINEILRAQILPTSICEGEDTIRTSYFEVLDGTAEGGVAPYTYSWDFDTDGEYTTNTGLGPHRVTYPNEGNRTITLTVTDAEGVSRDFVYYQYVGECYVDNCGSNDFSLIGYYIGDANGNRVNSSNCNDGEQKYIYVRLDQNPSRYSLYAEFTYSVTSLETGITTVVKENGCFYEQQEIPSEARAIPINYNCGDEVSIDNIYLTYSNNKNRSCGQSQNPKCYSTNNQEIIFTPLYAQATPNQLNCFDSELGTITVQASGGRAPYQYSRSNANGGYQSDNVFRILKAGDYNVWVRDAEGSVFQIPTVTITQPDTPITMEFEIQQPVCYGDKASVTVNPTGGTPYTTEDVEAYEYLWNDAESSTSRTLDNLDPGEYTVTVIDSNQCQAIQTITITQPEQLTQAISGSDQALGCGYYETSLEGNSPEVGSGIWTVESGPANYNFSDPTNPNSDFSGDEGEYILRWTIYNENCSNYDELHLNMSADCSTLDFDGVDDHILMSDSFDINTKESFTIESWIKAENTTGTKTILAKKDLQNFNTGGYDFVINSGSPAFRWNGNSISTSYRISQGIWHHVAVIYENSTIRLYVDGVRLASRSANLPADNSAPFIIGAIYNSANPDIPSNYFNGWIEELRIWNKSLTEEQLRFLMNQRIEINSNPLRGTVLPLDVPGDLNWDNLEAYYQLIGNSEALADGVTPDFTGNNSSGLMRNISTSQENTAPLPYVLNEENQDWTNNATWRLASVINQKEVSERQVWKAPGAYGIDGNTTIDWNIVEISKNVFYPFTSTTQPLQLLGLISISDTLDINGTNPPEASAGNPLIITDYLKLDGVIDLNGESQLIQTEGSVLDANSTGSIQRDQQGTANSYNYNYWSSPVSTGSPNSGFTIAEVLKDGTDPKNIQDISFKRQYTWADTRNYSGEKRISTYWLNTFHQTATYAGWQQIDQNTPLSAGVGYTMKGTSGAINISSLQNYTFSGLPNNGNILLPIKPRENFLIGNPYPSAIDGEQFILDNLSSETVNGATGDKNLFNGAVYFWDHFGQTNSHYLQDYVGGYATLNLIGSVPAVATDERINANSSQSERLPGRYIPIGQGFFVSSYLSETFSNITISEGDILFRNEQRVFRKENTSEESQFLRPESVFMKTLNASVNLKTDDRQKIRLNFRSPDGIHRQIVVGADENTTSGFDLGYDAPLYDRQREDMFWLIDNQPLVIQGVPDFNKERELDLGVLVRSNNEFYIEIDSLENIPSEKEIYLLDRTDSTYFDLKTERYTATIDSGYYNDRFAITFQKIEEQDENDEENEEEETPDDNEDDSEENPDDENPDDDTNDPEKPDLPENEETDDDDITGSFKVYYLSKDESVYLENPELIKIDRVLIYNINGSLVKDYHDIPTVDEIYIPLESKISSAVYILRIYTENGVTNLKFVKN